MTGGQTINFGYDNDDLLTSAGAMTITRDPATGFVTATVLGAIHETRTYDAYGAEQTYTVTASGNTLYSVDYGTRDGLGRITTKTETIQSETHVFGYSYYPTGGLKDVTKDGNLTAHYEYDANSNRLVGPGLTASPVYDSQDRLQTYGNCTYSYKGDGSLQTKTCPSGTTAYDYDAFGNLRGVTLPNGTIITYVIDGTHRRNGKRVNGVLTEGFSYRGQLEPIAWLNANGSVRATFVYGTRPNVPEYMILGSSSYRLIADQVGTVRLVADVASGAVVERTDYDEFGVVLSDSALGIQPFGFAGGIRDFDSGLTRFGTRDYDPAIGRWTQKDALLFLGGSSNLYSYIAGDAVNANDPTGLASYLCLKPLNALAEFGGMRPDQKRSFSEDMWNPLFHEFVCTDNPNPSLPPICGGLQSSNGGILGWGARSQDEFSRERCLQMESKKQGCFDQCVLGAIQGSRPTIYFLGGYFSGPIQNCQAWATDALLACYKRCGR